MENKETTIPNQPERLNAMEIMARMDQVTDQQINEFLEGINKPEFKEVFDKLTQDEKIKFVFVSQLADEEIKVLGDSDILPRFKDLLANLTHFTGDEKYKNLMSQVKEEPDFGSESVAA